MSKRFGRRSLVNITFALGLVLGLMAGLVGSASASSPWQQQNQQTTSRRDRGVARLGTSCVQGHFDHEGAAIDSNTIFDFHFCAGGVLPGWMVNIVNPDYLVVQNDEFTFRAQTFNVVSLTPALVQVSGTGLYTDQYGSRVCAFGFNTQDDAAHMGFGTYGLNGVYPSPCDNGNSGFPNGVGDYQNFN